MGHKQLIINKSPSETRVAVIEKDRVTSLIFERAHDRGIVGNIYKGRVSRVLPGMQSAFIDIGVERTAFLYGGDVIDPTYLERKRQEYELGTHQNDGTSHKDELPKTPIEKLLQDGQEITVQVTKEPLGTKGARVTMFLSLPGRYLVLMPDFHHIAISRRIESEATRNELESIVSAIKPPEMGVIIRTAAVGSRKEDFEKDLRYLLQVWEAVKEQRHSKPVPSLLYAEPEIHIKTTRDLYDDQINEIVIDDAAAYQEMKAFLDDSIPGASQKLKLYEKNTPIFDEYGVEVEIARALSRKVWLPSGGSIVIDQTEALTSFDVNTGRFVGKASAQETILKTNLEAISAIVAQLKLRNIGGIIVLDFIDMLAEADRIKVYTQLEEALKADKAKTNVLKISEIGLVQMTRKRTSESLEHQLMDACPYCDGRGRVRSLETETYDMFRDIERYATSTNAKAVSVRLRPDMYAWISSNQQHLLRHVEHKHQIEIKLQAHGITSQQLRAPAYEVITESQSS